LPEKFFCKENIWSTTSRTCEDPEDEWVMGKECIALDKLNDGARIIVRDSTNNGGLPFANIARKQRSKDF